MVSVEKINYVVVKDELNEAIREMKLSLNRDTLQTHDVSIEDDNMIVNIYYEDDKYFAPSYRVFGKIRGEKIFFGRVQYVEGMYDAIDVYDEFIANREIFDFE